MACSWQLMCHWGGETIALCYGGSTIPSLTGIQWPESPFLPASAPAWLQSSWATQPERPGEWHCKTTTCTFSHRDKIYSHTHQVVKELFYKLQQHEETVWQREEKQGNFQRMSAISWELKLNTFISFQFRRKVWLTGLSREREWSEGEL